MCCHPAKSLDSLENTVLMEPSIVPVPWTHPRPGHTFHCLLRKRSACCPARRRFLETLGVVQARLVDVRFSSWAATSEHHTTASCRPVQSLRVLCRRAKKPIGTMSVSRQHLALIRDCCRFGCCRRGAS